MGGADESAPYGGPVSVLRWRPPGRGRDESRPYISPGMGFRYLRFRIVFGLTGEKFQLLNAADPQASNLTY